MEGVERFPELVAGLLAAGMEEEEVGGILGGNLVRVWREIEEVGRKLREEGAEVLEEPEGINDRPWRTCPNVTAGWEMVP